MNFRISDGKSGSREVAFGLLMFWAFITGWLLWWKDAKDLESYRWIYDTITSSIFLFAGGAFIGNAIMNKWPAKQGTSTTTIMNKTTMPRGTQGRDPDAGVD